MAHESAEAEQRAAEADARENGEVLSLARRAAKAGTWDLDLQEGRVRYCPRSLEMLGHPPDRSPLLTAEEWAQHIFPGDAERVIAEGMRAREAGTELITEYRILKPDGGVRWIRAMGRTLFDDSGAPVRSVGFNFDVTDEKEAQALFRRMQAGLIKGSRANATATMAETLAHKLNQPLSEIANCLAGARPVLNGMEDEAAKQLRTAIDQAIEAAERAAEIVMRLQALKRKG